MAGSVLCSRGMGLSLMSSFASGSIAGGANTPKHGDKAGVTAASPLLFECVTARPCFRPPACVCAFKEAKEDECVYVLW